MTSTFESKTARGTAWATRIILTLAALPFITSAIIKLSNSPGVVQGFAQAGIPESAIVRLGLIELICTALYFVRRTTVLGSLLLTGYLGGAILANLIMHTSIVIPAALGVLLWTVTWLRVSELRALLPFGPGRIGYTKTPMRKFASEGVSA